MIGFSSRRTSRDRDARGGVRGRSFGQLLVIGAVLAYLNACGSSSPGTASSSSSGGSGSQTTAPPACTVIKQGEAAALVGSSVTQQDSGNICLWTGAGGGTLNVEVFAPGTDPKVTVRSGRACNFGASSSVSVGDVAVYCSTPSETGSGITFAKGGLLVQLACNPDSSSTTPCDKNSFIATAQNIAGRL